MQVIVVLLTLNSIIVTTITTTKIFIVIMFSLAICYLEGLVSHQIDFIFIYCCLLHSFIYYFVVITKILFPKPLPISHLKDFKNFINNFFNFIIILVTAAAIAALIYLLALVWHS